MILPLFPIFNWLGIEQFEWPNKQTVGLLAANAFIGTVISDYCWARSVVLLGPLITQLGITLTFPISLTVDVLSKGESFSWGYYLGSLFIFVAFCGIIWIEHKESKAQSNSGYQEVSLTETEDTERMMKCEEFDVNVNKSVTGTLAS